MPERSDFIITLLSRLFLRPDGQDLAGQDVLVLRDGIDNVEKELQKQLGCEAVIHTDPVDIGNTLTEATRRRMAELVRCIDGEISIHDFRMVSGPAHTNVIM